MVPLLCVALLAGCAAPSVPPMSVVERDIIRTEIDDDNWSTVKVEYPEASRPDVVVKGTIDDRDWSSRMVDCLRDMGFTVNVTDGYFSFGGNSGRPPIDYAVSTYVCRSRYPTLTQLIQYLDRRQLDKLYLYYVGTVRPCLLLAGAPSPMPPTRFAFVLSAFRNPSWHPFQVVWESGLPDPRVRYLEQRCPPIPTWLDLHG
ncbi:MAG: hypothetical protein JWO18_2339 [Microbacteriaceae bacterium]|jgi:hypothetical protein|nr:hypothetical protein [Microbacteriaceae bacterium]